MSDKLLLACAIADAHGLAVENLSPRRIARWFPHENPPFSLLGNRGLISDDTEHAAMVTQAFASSGGDPDLFERHLARHLRRWLWALPPATGLATARALIKLSIGFSPARSGVFSAGNGACMRAPILGALARNQDHLWELVLRSSRMTHRDPRAIEGAYTLALWVYLARNGQPPTLDELIAAMCSKHIGLDSAILHAVSEVRDSLSAGKTVEEFIQNKGWHQGPSGFVMQTLQTTLHVVSSHPSNWEAAVRRAVRLGGDTDSIAALVGTLLASLPNLQPPQEWVPLLVDWPRTTRWLDRVEQCAVMAAEGNMKVDPPGVNLLACLVRNLLFLAVVLVHGIRRAFPPYG